MTITPKLHDALAAARQVSAPQSAAHSEAGATAAGAMAPLSLTPLAPPRAAATDESAPAQPAEAQPGMVPTMRRELFDRKREQLLALLDKRDFGELPPSWAAISGRLSQEEATAAAAALQLIAVQVSS